MVYIQQLDKRKELVAERHWTEDRLPTSPMKSVMRKTRRKRENMGTLVTAFTPRNPQVTRINGMVFCGEKQINTSEKLPEYL